MSLTYRAVPDDEAHRSAYRRLLQYAFAPERGPEFDDEPTELPGEFELRGLYDVDAEAGARAATPTETVSGRPPTADTEPSAIAVAGALIDFRLRLRGEWRPVGGISAVASPPERRRRGHVGSLLDHVHAELRDRGVGLAVLWPFSHPFYRRFGYGRVNEYVVHEFPPDALETPVATPNGEGTVDRLSVDDVDALTELHEAAAPEPLAMCRSPDWWRLRIFRSWTEERYVYGWRDETGRLRSYLAYTIENGDGDEGRSLVVNYWGAVDEEARRQLFSFLRNHDSQVETVRLVAADASLFDRLADPADADASVKPGPMVRVVDVETALSGLTTPASDAAVVVRVRDARDDRNRGAFEIGVADGLTTCRRQERGEPAVTVDVAGLSRLVVGARSAAALADLEQLEGDDDAVTRLDALLPEATPAPYLREFF